MRAVAFDNTMLSILLNPNFRPPLDPSTGKLVELARERADAVVEQLSKRRVKIILPAPACAELLTVIGPEAQQYLSVVSQSRVFEVAAFDNRCASELAFLNRDTFKLQDIKNRAEPYQKVKVDRQIIAICRVNNVAEIYTDDGALGNRARLCGIVPKGIADIPIPESARQLKMELDPHDPLPEPEETDSADNEPS